jgi:CrcB protein
MRAILLVGFGGFAGAVLRYGAGRLVVRYAGSGFPWATLAVNVLGSLLLGAFVGSAQGAAQPSQSMRLLVAVGLLGSFTTFSTFGAETLELAQAGALGRAVAYAGASLVLGLAAVWLGAAWARP